jgi:hypothetical protein
LHGVKEQIIEDLSSNDMYDIDLYTQVSLTQQRMKSEKSISNNTAGAACIAFPPAGLLIGSMPLRLAGYWSALS